MLEYIRIAILERIDINKINASKECDICHFWHFLDKGFKYEPYICNGFHNLRPKVLNFNDVAIVSVEGSDYRVHFWYMCKDDAINTIYISSNLIGKSGLL